MPLSIRDRALARTLLALPLIWILGCLCLSYGSGGQSLAGEPTTPLSPSSIDAAPWPFTDALGRSVPTPDAGEVPVVRPNRFVGIFYFLWHDNRGGAKPGGGPYDIAKILEADPDALSHPDSPLWGPVGSYHYWGEPLNGYYLSDDAWVIRRHARLLADAGVDTLIFDATNNQTYPAIYSRICEVFTAIRKAGGRTPAISFMVNTEAGQTAQRLYEDLYRPGRFRDLWFVWEGKPLLLCDPKEASPEVREFFTLRRAHWPFTMVNTQNAWHWEATYPQPYGYTDDPNRPEQVNVSVAQNLRASDGQVTDMSDGNARGRSFHDGKADRSPGAVLRGHNAEEQWKRARELDPPFVMVTGWNEWIAGRWKRPGRPIVFVDQYDQEYSRDIEPMRGGHGDNYYGQLVANIRRYKGASPLPPASPAKSIRVDESFRQWADVGPVYGDDAGDASHRDHDGAAGTHYENRSGRNDLVAMKVARDDSQVAFYVRTQAPLVPAGRPEGLWLLIDADQNPRTGWEGYDYIVNRSAAGDGGFGLEKNAGGWNWTRVAEVQGRVEGNELQFIIPLERIGKADEGRRASFDFKWVDNLQKPGDVMDFYVSGDVAPESRFKFRYSGGGE
jgi:hypothetical protein